MALCRLSGGRAAARRRQTTKGDGLSHLARQEAVSHRLLRAETVPAIPARGPCSEARGRTSDSGSAPPGDRPNRAAAPERRSAHIQPAREIAIFWQSAAPPSSSGTFGHLPPERCYRWAIRQRRHRPPGVWKRRIGAWRNGISRSGRGGSRKPPTHCTSCRYHRRRRPDGRPSIPHRRISSNGSPGLAPSVPERAQ